MGKLSEGKQLLVVFIFFVVICLVIAIICIPDRPKTNRLTVEIEKYNATATIENISVNKIKNNKPLFNTKVDESKRLGVYAKIKFTFDTPLRTSLGTEYVEDYLYGFFSPIMIFGRRVGTDWQGTASIIGLSYTLTESDGISEVVVEIYESMKYDVNSISILMNNFRRSFYIHKSYWR